MNPLRDFILRHRMALHLITWGAALGVMITTIVAPTMSIYFRCIAGAIFGSMFTASEVLTMLVLKNNATYEAVIAKQGRAINVLSDLLKHQDK